MTTTVQAVQHQGVVSYYAESRDEREAWEARAYLQLVLGDLSLLFESAMVGVLPVWPKSVNPVRDARECAGVADTAPAWSGADASHSAMSEPSVPPARTVPCSAGHDADVWCHYCLPAGASAQ